MRTAVADWRTAVPQLGLVKVTSASDHDMRIFLGDCIELRGLYNVEAWHTDTRRLARYWDKATICVNNDDKFVTRDVILATISHELGHAYSLNEVYFDPADISDENYGDCTLNVVSIMNGANSFPNPSNPSTKLYDRHCNNLTAPHLRDRILVRDVYTGGQTIGTLAELHATDNRDQTATFSWEDNA